MRKFFVILFALLCTCAAHAEDQDIAALFAQRGLDGTLVLSSLHGGKMYIHNEHRARQRYSPASTFKIMNTLIALEVKAISGRHAVFKWDGFIYELPDWNHDQTLESAFKFSCIWCYQQLARRVGAEEYRNDLRKADYGVLHEPFELTTFWLDGSLQISAMEQIDVLKKIYLRTLPFSTHSYDTLQQIMFVEKTPSYALWGKTGWATSVTPHVGWYVGYIETPSNVWFFSTNIEVRDKQDLPLRQQITRDALQLKIDRN